MVAASRDSHQDITPAHRRAHKETAMVRIRMQRFGRKHRPFYRINAIDQRTRRNGKVIEPLGHYDPMHPSLDQQVVLKVEAIRKWLDKGAQPSDTVRDLLGNHDILNEDEKKAWEKDRARARDLATCRAAVKAAEAAAAEIAKLAESAEADLTSFENNAKKAVTAAKSAMPLANADAANAAKADAESQLDAAKKAEASAKPEPEPEEAPAEEAAEEASE